MAPAQTLPTPAAEPQAATLLEKKSATESKTNDVTEYEVAEDYNGQFKFAPIKESQVARAMIKRSVYWA